VVGGRIDTLFVIANSPVRAAMIDPPSLAQPDERRAD
jgi:hypothetical protein